MIRFLLVRAFGAVGVLLALITVVFVLQTAVPGDPVRASVGVNASDEVVEAERDRLGLDEPLPIQYATYLGQVARGGFGESLRTGREVRADIGAFLPATLELAGFSIILAGLGGLLIGILAVVASRLATPARLLFVGGASVPSFLLALILIYVFYFKLSWLPLSGRTSIGDAPQGPTGMLLLDSLLHSRLDVFVDAARHLILPGLALALVPAVAIGRVLRSSLIEVYRADYIRTLHAKGLAPWAVLFRHALRNAVSAPLTMAGLQLGLLLGGVVIVEAIFAWPGIGLYLNQSIAFGDLRAISGVTLVVGAGYVLVNTLVDLAQAAADPRIRL